MVNKLKLTLESCHDKILMCYNNQTMCILRVIVREQQSRTFIINYK